MYVNVKVISGYLAIHTQCNK